MDEQQNNEQEELQDSKLKQVAGNVGKQVEHEAERQAINKIKEAILAALSKLIALLGAKGLIIIAIILLIAIVGTIFFSAIEDLLDVETSQSIDEVINMNEYCTIDENGVRFDKDKFIATLPRILKEEIGVDFNDLGLGTVKTDSTGYFLLNSDSQAAKYLYRYMAASLSSQLPYIEGSDEETKGIIKIKRKKSDITVEAENTKGYIFVGESHVHKLEEALTENDIFLENPSTYVSNSINSKSGEYKYEYGTSGNGTGGNLFFIHTLYDGTEPEYGTSVSNMTQEAFPDWIYNGDGTSNGIRTYQGTATAFERIKKIISNNTNIENWNIVVMQGYSSALLGQGVWDSYLNNLNSMKSELSKLGGNLYVSSTPHSNAGIWQQDTCYSYGKDSIINNLQGSDSNDNNAIYDQYNQYTQNGFSNFINVTSSSNTNSRGKDGNEYKKYENKLDSTFCFDNYAHIDLNHYDSSTMYAWGEYIINVLDGNVSYTPPTSGNTNQNSNNTEEIELKYIGYQELQDMINSDNRKVKEESLKYFSLDESWNLCVTKWSINSKTDEEEEYQVYEVKIPYKNMISGYTVPFIFLIDLQLVSQNANYVDAVANLMKNESYIDLTVFDSITTDETTYTYEATKHTKTKNTPPASNTIGSSTTSSNTISGSSTTPEYTTSSEQEGPNVTVTKIETDTVKANVTRAKTWIIDQTTTYNLQQDKEYPYEEEGNGRTKTETKSESEPSGEGIWRDPITETWYEEITKNEWVKGNTETKFMPSEFLGLWKNNAGKYVQGALYVTTKNGGKIVEYNILDGSSKEAPVTNIIPSREQLYDLLAGNQTTQIHSEMMKEIINFYLTGEELTGETFSNSTFVSMFEPSEFVEGSYVGGDFDVHDESLFITDLETLKRAFQGGYSKSEKLVANAQAFLDMQQKYKVNAIFAASVSITETGAGNAGNAIAYTGGTNPKTGRVWQAVGSYNGEKWNNWFDVKTNSKTHYGIIYNGEGESHYKIYSSIAESIDGFGYNIAEGSYYYKEGRYTVASMGERMCPNCDAYPTQMEDWIALTLAQITKFYNAAGKDISSETSPGNYGGEVIRYYQNDYANVPYGNTKTSKYGTIATRGCGPTSFAMVATTLTGRTITPKDALSWCGDTYYVPGSGTGWAYFNAAAKHYGFSCTQTNNFSQVEEALRNGKLVISSQGKGLFTNGGHYILLTKSEGGRIYVNDPNKNNAINKGYNNRGFTASEITHAAKQYWIFE